VVSSLSAKFGVPKLSAYAAAKHAAVGFFESLRTEVRKDGIRVCFIIPGFVNTSILQKAVDGNGEVTGKNLAVNEKGISPGLCAMKMVRAIKKGRQETLIGRSERWSVYLHRFFPGMFHLMIANHPIRKLQRALSFFAKRN
jgi:short-subunit dehydrogenase